MPLPSFLQSKASKVPRDEGLADDAGPVHEARVRARRRLIGAVVLLAVGLVVFPLLFESKPRPLPMDIPIEVARKDSVAALPVAPKPAPRAAAVTPPPDAGNEAAGTSAAANEPAPLAAKPEAPAVAPAPLASVVVAVAAPQPTRVEVGKATPPPPAPAIRAAPATPASPTAPASPATSGRFVVQVGAFTDATAVREARSKVEKLGLKTYTQVVETPSGNRTRVRVGPFETRDEADKASARLKASGLPAYILAL